MATHAAQQLSDAHALLAIELIGQNLLSVIENPGDKKGRLALATAASMAGAAFSNAMVGMVHTLGHAVGAVCGVSHGNCMAILLPYASEYNMHNSSHLIAPLLLPLAGARVAVQSPRHLRAKQVVATIRQLNQRLYQATDGVHARFFNEITGPDGNARVTADALESIAENA